MWSKDVVLIITEHHLVSNRKHCKRTQITFQRTDKRKRRLHCYSTAEIHKEEDTLEENTQHLCSTLSFHSTRYITPTAITKPSILLSWPPAVELFFSYDLKSLPQSSSEVWDWCLCDPPKQSSAPVIRWYMSLMSSHSLKKWFVASNDRDTNIYSEDREERSLSHHTESHFILCCTENLITWLLFPSSLGTSRWWTETNLNSRWQEITSIKCCLECSFFKIYNYRLQKCHLLLHDGLEELQTWLKFFLRVVGLYSCAHCGDVHPVWGHVVGIRHYRDVNVCKDKRGKRERDTRHHGNSDIM